MTKEKLRDLLSDLWNHDLSADDVFNELEELIDENNRLTNTIEYSRQKNDSI